MGNDRTTVAVVTGGHSYDVPAFHGFFRGIPDADCHIQHMDDFASSSRETREAYDVILFYIMLMDGPTDEGLPWHLGKPRTALEELGRTEQGIFVLHHALLAYPGWPPWSEIVGVEKRGFGYHFDQRVRIEIADTDHPITKGLTPWEMTDETYTMADAGEGSRILLTTDHPKSMHTIAWTRGYGDSRVFCLESGHDGRTWGDPNFREVVSRGIQWAARRI
jgi:hypothetical protein